MVYYELCTLPPLREHAADDEPATRAGEVAARTREEDETEEEAKPTKKRRRGAGEGRGGQLSRTIPPSQFRRDIC